jgi:hypothetical protein
MPRRKPVQKAEPQARDDDPYDTPLVCALSAKDQARYRVLSEQIEAVREELKDVQRRRVEIEKELMAIHARGMLAMRAQD